MEHISYEHLSADACCWWHLPTHIKKPVVFMSKKYMVLHSVSASGQDRWEWPQWWTKSNICDACISCRLCHSIWSIATALSQFCQIQEDLRKLNVFNPMMLTHAARGWEVGLVRCARVKSRDYGSTAVQSRRQAAVARKKVSSFIWWATRSMKAIYRVEARVGRRCHQWRLS